MFLKGVGKVINEVFNKMKFISLIIAPKHSKTFCNY